MRALFHRQETLSGTSWRFIAIPILVAFGGLAFHPATAPATSLVLEGTANLLEKADTVVSGTVTGIEARMHPEHHFIYTYVTVKVEEVFKGTAVSPGQEIVLQELGGTVGRTTHQVAAVPRFELGERILDFLEDREDGLFRTYGMIQGKFRFETDARSGQEILTRPAEWTDTYLAATGEAADLTAIRADGAYDAAPLLSVLRDGAGR